MNWRLILGIAAIVLLIAGVIAGAIGIEHLLWPPDPGWHGSIDCAPNPGPC